MGLYLHQYAGTVSALPSGASLQTRGSTWPLHPSSTSAQEDESVTMSISVIAALTCVKAARVSSLVLTQHETHAGTHSLIWHIEFMQPWRVYFSQRAAELICPLSVSISWGREWTSQLQRGGSVHPSWRRAHVLGVWWGHVDSTHKLPMWNRSLKKKPVAPGTVQEAKGTNATRVTNPGNPCFSTTWWLVFCLWLLVSPNTVLCLLCWLLIRWVAVHLLPESVEATDKIT